LGFSWYSLRNSSNASVIIDINKFKAKNPTLAIFFQEIQNELLNDLNDSEQNENNDDEYNNSTEEQQVANWFQNQNLTQTDPNQVNKITDRQQKIQAFDNQHVPMKQEQIATTDTYQVPVKQDSLNPNLKNTISRFVNLDSQFRQYAGINNSTATCYTCDLSDTLKDALSLRLYSYQIPYSWYTIDTDYGNTCFWINHNQYNINISIPPGNYTQSSFQTQINNSFLNAGFTFPAYPPVVTNINSPVFINTNNGIVTMYLYGGTYNDPNHQIPSFTIDSTTQILFYDFTGNLYCGSNCLNKSNHYFNSSLGWLMGYRLPYMNVITTGNTATAILDLTAMGSNPSKVSRHYQVS
jgi:hypothetical protein